MSSTLASSSGMTEKRTRVRPRGSSSSSCRLTHLVANEALAVGSSAKVATRSATLSLTNASTEQSLFSPRSRSAEHTSELQSRQYLVCRLLLEQNTLLYL